MPSRGRAGLASRSNSKEGRIFPGWQVRPGRCRKSRMIASLATTGSSTSNPRAMIRAAIEICWMSIPRIAQKPRVMAIVIGIDRATAGRFATP